MIRKVIIVMSKIVITITALNIFAGAIAHVTSGGERFGVLTNGIKEFAMFPKTVKNVFKELIEPERLARVDPNFEQINNLKYDLFALNSTYKQDQWMTSLTNLKNDSVILQWVLDIEDYDGFRVFSHSAPMGPIILKDTSLILHNDESRNLFRLNSNSEMVWKNNDLYFHHTINLDHSGSIWACTMENVLSPDKDLGYFDDHITKVDVETGEILFHKSLSQIFLDNDLGYIIHGYTNIEPVEAKGLDPFHLNEIEPILKDGPFWKKGDLLISLRHRSMILHYRPSTNDIIRIIQGKFYNQHDIDIISDSTISIFNNNTSSLNNTFKLIYGISPWVENRTREELKSLEHIPNDNLNEVSEVVLFDLSDSSFSSLYPKQFAQNNIFTASEGLHHIISNGDLFVEEQNDGKVFIFNENELVFKGYFNKPENGLIEYPHWVRVYENLNFLK